MGGLHLINSMPFSQNSPANQHDQHVPAHVQPLDTSMLTSTIQQASSVARNLCKEEKQII